MSSSIGFVAKLSCPDRLVGVTGSARWGRDARRIVGRPGDGVLIRNKGRWMGHDDAAESGVGSQIGVPDRAFLVNPRNGERLDERWKSYCRRRWPSTANAVSFRRSILRGQVDGIGSALYRRCGAGGDQPVPEKIKILH